MLFLLASPIFHWLERKASVRSRFPEAPDLLNEIEGLGGIRPRIKGKQEMGLYDGWDDVMREEETRLLVRREGMSAAAGSAPARARSEKGSAATSSSRTPRTANQH